MRWRNKGQCSRRKRRNGEPSEEMFAGAQGAQQALKFGASLSNTARLLKKNAKNRQQYSTQI